MKETEGERCERDLLGDRSIRADVLWGVHTERARENFSISSRLVHTALIRAYGLVKLACAKTNSSLGVWKEKPAKQEAILTACEEAAKGVLGNWICVDALQGGAGTSLNMNLNEVIANRALQLLGLPLGNYHEVSPADDINLHQSTNDTFPTALRLAAMQELVRLEGAVVGLQEAFQSAEKRFAHVVKVGRTQFQDAVLTTVGREMGAYAEAFTRDRWRIYKCGERLRVVNLGGTAIGSGLGAPRDYIFQVVDVLREVSGLPVARAENLIEATQNNDVFVEVSGMLKALAVSLQKICTDLRILSSGPEAGIGELILPARQAGSSIMPGKVNPVIPEAVTQACLLVQGYDVSIAAACAAGNLELNAFLPLVADCLLNSISMLTESCRSLSELCVTGIEVNVEKCRAHVENSVATATALIPVIGYEKSSEIARRAKQAGKSIRDVVVGGGVMTKQQFDELISPEAVLRLGSPTLLA